MQFQQNIDALCLTFLIAIGMNLVTSLPMKTPSMDTVPENGTLIYLDSKDDFRKLGNGTVPEAFLTDLTPPEYYQSKGKDMVSELFGTPDSTKRQRSVRSAPPSCPYTYIVEFSEDRQPPIIQKAVCNSKGSMCISGLKRSACTETYVEKMVYYYKGQQGSRHVVLKMREKISVLCKCSSS